MRVPFCDVAAVNAPYAREIGAAVTRVVESGRLVLGSEVAAFEREAARYLGARHAVSVGCGTDALILALVAAGARPGDEVVVPDFGIFVDAEAVFWVGAIPVPVNAHADGTPVASEIEEVVSERTRAIIVPTLFGGASSIAPLQAVAARLGLMLIEDACQAFGAREDGRAVGTRGRIGCFSFFPTKVLGALGDGGLLVTDDAAVADCARMLRSHGTVPEREKYRNVDLGLNTRLDEIHAAILRVKLQGLDAALERRRAVASRYRERLSEHVWLTLPEAISEHTYYSYAVRCDTAERRDALRAWLAADGVEAPIHFPIPIHRQPAFIARLGELARRFDVSERLSATVLSLPCHPALTAEDTEYVARSIARFARERP